MRTTKKLLLILSFIFASVFIMKAEFDREDLVYFGWKYITEEELYDEGVEMLEKAYGMGSSDAAYLLGRFYEFSEPPYRNHSKAQSYFTQAAKSGNSDAQRELYLQYLNGVSTLTQNEAVDWLLEAANQENPYAIYELAHYYKRHAAFGQAQDALADAAFLGFEAAIIDLGIAWYEGNFIWTGDRKDYDKAFAYLNQVEDSLDRLYFIRDDVKAAAYLTLSKCYRFGRGVKKDVKKADELLNMAAQFGDPDAIDIQQILNR